MHYDPILCMNVPDKAITKDAEFQMFGPEFHHPIIKASSKEEAIKKAKEIYGWGGKVEAVKVSDEKPIDKAIKAADKAEFDPQDIQYIKRAIGSLKTASSVLGMINEPTVNKVKDMIAKSTSFLESAW